MTFSLTKELQILIDHKSFQIIKIEKNIINVHHKKGVMTIDVFKDLINFIENWTGVNGVYALNTQERGFNFDSETWQYIQKEAPGFSFIIAQSLVAKELHFRILAKFFVKTSSKISSTNYKVVRNYDDGLDWLKQRAEIDTES